MTLPWLAILLAGCPLVDDTPVNCQDYLVLYDVDEEISLSGASWQTHHVSSADPGDLYYGLWTTLELQNDSAAEDCLVAVYVGDAAPDETAIPTLDPTVGAPATVEGVGTLWDQDFLAKDWGTPDRWWIEAYLAENEGYVWRESSPVDAWLTVVTCADPELSGHLRIEAQYCADAEDLDTLRPPEAEPDSWSYAAP